MPRSQSPARSQDRKSTRLNSSHTVISPLSLHDALPIFNAGASGKCPTFAPIIIVQPLNRTVPVGSIAGFSAVAGGSPPLGYQWTFNGTAITGSTNAALTITSAQPRSEEHTSELQSHSDLTSFPTRRSSDLQRRCEREVPDVRAHYHRATAESDGAGGEHCRLQCGGRGFTAVGLPVDLQWDCDNGFHECRAHNHQRAAKIGRAHV